MKTRKLFSVLLAPAFFLALTMNCSEDEAISHSVNDVSSKITGFSSDITGAGASLSINGSDMDKVVRVCMDQYCVASRLFTAVSESSITYNVPTAIPLGESDVLIVFSGSDRAYGTIDVVPLPAIVSFTPYSATTGELVKLVGTNFDIVTEVNIGGIAGTITSQSATFISFTVPAGTATGKITLVSPAGSANSAADLIACSANPASSDCPDGLNLNDGFEIGAGDTFDNWGQWNGGQFMEETLLPGEVFRGSRGMKVIRDGSLSSGEWRIQLASDLVTTEIGASYTVYVWAKAAFPGGSMRVSTNPNALYTGNQNVPTTWTRLAFTFTANETSTRVVMDMNGNNTAVTTFFVDDIKFIKN